MDPGGPPQTPTQPHVVPLGSTNVEQPLSPLERLDPQRLREQAVALHLGTSMQGVSSDKHWSPVTANVNVNSPTKSVQSPMSVTQQRHSSGSVESLQHFSTQQFFSNSNDIGYVLPQSQEFSKNPLQSPGVVPVQLSSPSVMPQSPYIARTPNPTAQSPIPSNPRSVQPYSNIIMNNGQPSYSNQTTATLPGTPVTPQRMTFPVRQGGPFNYPSTPQTPQQWSNVPPQQQQVQHYNVRMAQQPPRAIHRFPQNYNSQNVSQSPYSTSIPASPQLRMVPVRQQYQVVTSQPQQVQTPLPQQAGQPQPPLTPTPHAPGIPTTPNASGVPQPTGFYPPPGYPSNYQQPNQPTYQQRPQTPQPSPTRSFIPGANVAQDPALYVQMPAVGTAQTVGKSVSSVLRPQIPVPAVFAQDANGLRSPSIVSLNQPLYLHQQLQHPSAALTQRALMQPSGIRPQMQVVPDPRSIVPPHLCLAGCYFLISDHQTFLDTKNIISMIKYYGGEGEMLKHKKSDRNIELESRFTHIIADSVLSPHVSSVLSPNNGERKDRRICTLQWLNDVIERRHVEAPFKVCHLPAYMHHRVVHTSAVTDKIISSAGFTKQEVSNLMWMTHLIGAKFSPYLTKDTSFLIAKSPTCLKAEKYRDLHANIQVVNANWLCELYLGITSPLGDTRNQRYNVSKPAPLELGAQNIIKISDNCVRIMYPWQFSLPITDEILRRAEETHKSIVHEELNLLDMYSVLSESGPTPTQEQVDAAVTYLEQENKRPETSVFFTGLPSSKIDVMRRKIQVLGVRIAERVEDCTVVVTPFLARTVPIIKALALGKDLISPLWVLNSFKQLRLLSLEDFFLYENAIELSLHCNPRSTVLMAQKQRIFTNMCFFVSPSVRPSRTEVREIIQCGGGTIDENKPTKSTIYKAIEEDRPYIIISHCCDLPFFQKLTDSKIPIFSEEFVFCAVMRYKIDTTNAFAINLKKDDRKTGNQTGGVPNLMVMQHILNSST